MRARHLSRRLREHFTLWSTYQRGFNPEAHRRAIETVWGSQRPSDALRAPDAADQIVEYLDALGEDPADWISDALGKSTSLPLYLWQITTPESRSSIARKLRSPGPARPPTYFSQPLVTAQTSLPPRLFRRRAWHEARTASEPDVRLEALGLLMTQSRRNGHYPTAATLSLHALQTIPEASHESIGVFLTRLHYMPAERLELQPALQLCHNARSHYRAAGLPSHVGRTYADEASLCYLFGRTSQIPQLLDIARSLLLPSELHYQLAALHLVATLEADRDELSEQRVQEYMDHPCPPHLDSTRAAYAKLLLARQALNRGGHSDAAEILWSLVFDEAKPSITFRVEVLLYLAASATVTRNELHFTFAASELFRVLEEAPAGPPPEFFTLLSSLPRQVNIRRAQATTYTVTAARLRQLGAS